MLKTCPNPECSVEFKAKDYRQKYCSHSCAARVNNGLRSVVELFCLECGRKLVKGQKKFCSRLHQTQYKKTSRIDRWKSGEDPASMSTSGVLKKWARDYLIAESGCACSLCGWNTPNPILGYPILTIDHIDGNWKNNRFDNLIVLCYNCHTLTETFGALNHGSDSGRRDYGLVR